MMSEALINPFQAPTQAPPSDVANSPMDERPRTYGEWQRLGLPMQWSIFKGREGENIDDWELDLSAPVEDGEYDAVYGDGRNNNNPFQDMPYDGRVEGIIVENGEFVPRPTAEAIYDLVRTFQTGRYGEIVRHGESMDHKFIEKIDYNPFGGYFRVQTGS